MDGTTTDQDPDATSHRLNDGTTLPVIGLGTAPLPNDATETAVEEALRIGYRLIDTGSRYGNEAGVGRALGSSAVPRDRVRVLTKVRGKDHGRAPALAAFEASRQALHVDVVDLYLIHWPLPMHDRYVETWRALIELQADGRVATIGVSNFTERHLERLIDETGVVPAVNQIEVHPGFPQTGLRRAHDALGIRTLCYSPLGHGDGLLQSPVLAEVAAVHGVSPAQVVLRWHLEQGLVPLPRASSTDRRRQNFDVFGFRLDHAQLDAISAAVEHRRIGWDPDTHEEL